MPAILVDRQTQTLSAQTNAEHELKGLVHARIPSSGTRGPIAHRVVAGLDKLVQMWQLDEAQP